MKAQIISAQQETESIIEELLQDGSDPDALYLIEHHISSHDFDILEKVAVEAFRLGYEATDPEEYLDENNKNIISCDIVSETPLDADLINAQIAQLMQLCHKFHVDYDGWGTYFEGDEDDDYDDVDDEEYDDESEEDDFSPTKH